MNNSFIGVLFFKSNHKIKSKKRKDINLERIKKIQLNDRISGNIKKKINKNRSYFKLTMSQYRKMLA